MKKDTLNLGEAPKPKLDINFAVEINNAVQRVLDGDDDALQTFVMLSSTEKIFKQAKDKIKSIAVEEFEKYGEKTLENFGAKISKTGSGRYSYKDYEGWRKLNNARKDIEKMMQTSYKMALQGDTYVSNDGEEIPPALYTPNEIGLSIKMNK